METRFNIGYLPIIKNVVIDKNPQYSEMAIEMPKRSGSLAFRVACAVSIGLSVIRKELATMSQVEIIDLSPHSEGIGIKHECEGLVIYASQFSSSIVDWIHKNPRSGFIWLLRAPIH